MKIKKNLLICIIMIAMVTTVGCSGSKSKKEEPEETTLNSVDIANGYVTEDYIKLGQTSGFTYEITQEQWDECVREETDYHEYVQRAAKDTDMVEYNIIGYVDGKQDENLTYEEQSITIGDDNTGFAAQVESALIGHKEGDEVVLNNVDPSEIAMEERDYSQSEVEIVLEVVSVSELVSDKVTDEWVKDCYYEDMGLETTEDFYEWCREYIVEYEIMEEFWQMTIDSATMKDYPSDVYDRMVEEIDNHLYATAEEYGMEYEEFLEFYEYTPEVLEEEYLNGVKSEMVMWQMVKDLNMEATPEEIEQEYENTYWEVGCESVEEMKTKYTDDEMKESVLLTKVKQYILDNSTIKDNYTINK